VARIVVAGAGAVGASIAYHLALLGADDVVLADANRIASGSTGKAMGGVRQQFSTAAEVSLARDSIQFFEELGPEYFQQVGYLFVATTEAGLAELDERRELQAGLGVPVERVEPAEIQEIAPGTSVDDVLGGTFCRTDGVADPPVVTREIVRRAAERGVEVREHTRAEDLDADTLVLACGAWSAEIASGFGVDLPIRPLCRQLFETKPLAGLAPDLPMVIDSETGFHYRRRDDTLRIAMPDPEPRWGFEEEVDESLFPDRLARLAHRFPATAGTGVSQAWAGLYDMTPDAHPIVDRIGDGLFAACGFSGHGFMQSPAVGRALAAWIVSGAPSADLSAYRLQRFEGATAADVETVVL
jgi:sarcosine oxidase subunit beta